ncbi:unsaturated glucuronyl hydrolase [Folsomia candida]|uniref:unsaturated glucuronyl hydrolase n=1 Tax=Folsomia candida TaxID=158441 RepID=UPI000B8F68E2|nr:unsaturated glucuronyl hydrolase [Folsomia candida]
MKLCHTDFHLHSEHFQNPILRMKLYALLVSLLFVALVSENKAQLPTSTIIDYAVRQYAILSERILGEEDFISTGNPLQPTWNFKGFNDWTVGFYGGSLWMLYKLTQDTYWRRLALEYQERIKDRQYDTSNHDVGFIIMSTFGLGLELTNDQSFVPVILQAAASLSSRYVPATGCIRSWNSGEPGEVTVIADNMMNLELLLAASELANFNPDYTHMVVSHSYKTREHHYHPDGSVNHVVAFNDSTGAVVRKYNVQGYSDSSAWSRGLAWTIHGFTSVYEHLNDNQFYLESAETAANFFINNLPADYVPYYDFKAPIETEYSPRDTAAASIAAHAFLKLFKITANPVYFETAEKIMENLISDKYRADGNPLYRLPAILVNGTVFFHQNDLDTAIVYADFYFLNALDVYIEIVGTKGNQL